MGIEVNHVSKSIKGSIVINDITCLFENGHVYGLKGINGSGKTMLMRILSGLVKPTSGTISINGETLHKDIDFPRSLGVLIENPAFLNQYTGYQNLHALSKIKGIADKKQINNTLSFVGLDPEDKRAFKKYSLGMKQRLGIAAAIFEEPEILILDEPLNALDEKGIPIIKTLVAKARSNGKVVILSCHDSVALESMVDSVLLLEEGKLCS